MPDAEPTFVPEPEPVRISFPWRKGTGLILADTVDPLFGVTPLTDIFLLGIRWVEGKPEPFVMKVTPIQWDHLQRLNEQQDIHAHDVLLTKDPLHRWEVAPGDSLLTTLTPRQRSNLNLLRPAMRRQASPPPPQPPPT